MNATHWATWVGCAPDVLGANDGIVSTSSLILGVAAANAAHDNILLSGAAGLVAGAMSMAIGEYVSVHSQADSEAAAIAQEEDELREDYAGERRELTDIYVRRGLELDLAKKVAQQLMDHDALGAHARDELGLTPPFHRPAIASGALLRGQLQRRFRGTATGGRLHRPAATCSLPPSWHRCCAYWYWAASPPRSPAPES